LCWPWQRSSREKGGSQGGGEPTGRRKVDDETTKLEEVLGRDRPTMTANDDRVPHIRGIP
jgi:hypothetical protein